MDEAKSLLEKVKLINLKYEKELHDIQFEFNIFSIKRGRIIDSSRLLFFVELGSYIYFGFTISKGENRNRKIALNPQYDYLAKIVKAVTADFKRDDWWIGKKDPSRKYDFETFDTPDVFALANPSKRVEYVNELVDEIKKLVSHFYSEYSKHVSSS